MTKWGLALLAACGLALLGPQASARISPGTTTTDLPDGTRRVTTDGRSTLYMQAGPTRVELRLGPSSRNEPIVLLDTPDLGLVTHNLAGLAPDVRVSSEIHLGMQWMLRYLVDRKHRVLLLAVGDGLSRMLGIDPGPSASKWVALSLEDGGWIDVTNDLVMQTHLASDQGRVALAGDILRDADLEERLEAVARDGAETPIARVRACAALHLANRPVEWEIVRRILQDPSAPARTRASAGRLLVSGRSKKASAALLGVAKRGQAGDGAAAGAGLAMLVKEDMLGVAVLRKLMKSANPEIRGAGLRGLAGADWDESIGGVLGEGARDPAVAEAAADALCSHGSAAWPRVGELLEEGGAAEDALLACLDPAMPRAVELLLLHISRGESPDDPAPLTRTLTNALWQSHAPDITRVTATEALLSQAELDVPQRFLAIQAALALGSRTPAIPLALGNVARTAGDQRLAVAARDLLLETRWDDEARGAQRQALHALWSERLDLIDPPTSLDVIRDQYDPQEVALLQRCLGADSQALREAASERLYRDDWRDNALAAFIEHVLTTPTVVPWTTDLLDLFAGRLLSNARARGLARAAGEADRAIADDAMARLTDGLWIKDMLGDAQAVDAVIALARSGPYRTEARAILKRWRWRDEAKAHVDAVSGELGLRKGSRDALMEGLQRRIEREKRR